MPIFGLVWVASWVGCFFPSSQELLQEPSHLSCASSVVMPHDMDSPRNQPHNAFTQTHFDASRLPLPSYRTALAGSGQASTTLLMAGNSLPQPFLQPASSGLLGSLRNFFLELGTVATTPIRRSVTIVPLTKVVTEQVAATDADRFDTAGMGLMECRQGSNGEPFTPSNDRQAFQIKVGGKVVGIVSLRQQAKQTAERLRQVLANPLLQPADLRPATIKGLPAVKQGDRLLFTMNDAVVQSDRCNAELTAISWVNNLRIALAEPPLSLAGAQQALYGLQETGEKIAGLASWYGPYFHGRQTATGEVFDQDDLTAAHPSLPFNTFLKVKNLNNGKTIIVRINDRGPYIDDRTLDLSREAARLIGSENVGVVPIEAVIMQPVSIPTTSGQRIASRL